MIRKLRYDRRLDSKIISKSKDEERAELERQLAEFMAHTPIIRVPPEASAYNIQPTRAQERVTNCKGF